MTQTVNKCVISKSKLQLTVLKSVAYLSRQTPHKTVLIKVNDFKYMYDSWLWGISLLILSDVLTRYDVVQWNV